VPQEGSFKTPVELAWKLRERALAAGLALERVGFDGRYGRNRELRAQMRQAGKLYRAEVAADTHVYLDKPLLGLLPRQSQHGRPPSAIQVLAEEAVCMDSLREKLGTTSRSGPPIGGSGASRWLPGCGRCRRARW
jgi:hypothetical protein